MKNLILGLSLVFGSSLAFGGTGEEKPVDEKPISKIEVQYTCVYTILSCGITGYACGGSTSDIVAVALAADDYYC